MEVEDAALTRRLREKEAIDAEVARQVAAQLAKLEGERIAAFTEEKSSRTGMKMPEHGLPAVPDFDRVAADGFDGAKGAIACRCPTCTSSSRPPRPVFMFCFAVVHIVGEGLPE
jgi:hypothetical protein